jgi:hypothetical protein
MAPSLSKLELERPNDHSRTFLRPIRRRWVRVGTRGTRRNLEGWHSAQILGELCCKSHANFSWVHVLCVGKTHPIRPPSTDDMSQNPQHTGFSIKDEVVADGLSRARPATPCHIAPLLPNPGDPLGKIEADSDWGVGLAPMFRQQMAEISNRVMSFTDRPIQQWRPRSIHYQSQAGHNSSLRGAPGHHNPTHYRCLSPAQRWPAGTMEHGARMQTTVTKMLGHFRGSRWRGRLIPLHI